MESVISKIIYLFKLPKILAAYSTTAVKTVVVVFFEIYVKQRTMSKLAFLSFVRILIFKFLFSLAMTPKTCYDLSYI